MSDLVARLRKQAREAASSSQYLRGSTKTCCTKWDEWKAADEIERLRTENRKLREFGNRAIERMRSFEECEAEWLREEFVAAVSGRQS